MNNEKCCICHESLNDNIYSLPECNHSFHTNCIITWFRIGKNSCPLCQNSGINSLKEVQYNTNYIQRSVAYENFKNLRSYSRRKDAPLELKKKFKKLKKLEDKLKELKIEIKEFENKKVKNLTVKQIIKKISNYRSKRWHLMVKIKKYKQLIGFSGNITKIIIPIKTKL
tara:strand:- start:33 stop:539 length:507 start_codon:yes stop_codon:yes gene_type:complete